MTDITLCSSTDCLARKDCRRNLRKRKKPAVPATGFLGAGARLGCCWTALTVYAVPPLGSIGPASAVLRHLAPAGRVCVSGVH